VSKGSVVFKRIAIVSKGASSMSLHSKLAPLVSSIVSSLLLIPLVLGGADSLPSLDQVTGRHIKALGGQSALEQLGTLALTGDCESTEKEEGGPVEILIRTPKVTFDLGGGSLRMGFNGEVVWRHAASEGLQKNAGRQHAEIVTVFDPTRVLRWKEWYPEMAVTAAEKAGNKEAYVLETHPGKPTERLFIDRQSGLLIRDEVMPNVVFTFSDYRAIDGVQLAFTIRQDTPVGVTYTYHFKEAKRLASVDESRFEPR
jgi:hypothetical protein